ncbi:NIF family HAD-type phosphatase [Variovorax saccharolyticus]|uniref:NIF family HAD-type phosphatase n=1 Tax=Variovorax saccharolyticus TaxID=3053516 RepID=UPI002576CD3B|nr:NIF family HAD-type phosphatase [Variovorax sp. J31P216]MDM0029859.1 NIF family HAD-type phosphatase [Variovorax sp. J31P216]
MHTYTVLALDLEGTLISNAVSQISRPGLNEFLARCSELFPRVVIFTTVPEPRFREIAKLLVGEGKAPAWFAELEYVSWAGRTKDLNFIQDAEVTEALLVDDFEAYVHPGQEERWVRAQHFDYPYPDTDSGLAEVLKVLERKLDQGAKR